MSNDIEISQYPAFTLSNLVRLITLSERPEGGLPLRRYDELRQAGADKTPTQIKCVRPENQEPKSVVEAMLLGL